MTAATSGEIVGLRNIYVGRLSSTTSTNDIRAHLHDIGVDHISDVMQLNCRKPEEASFCVSVDSSMGEELVYAADKWPAGIIIRPYRERQRRPVSREASHLMLPDDRDSGNPARFNYHSMQQLTSHRARHHVQPARQPRYASHTTPPLSRTHTSYRQPRYPSYRSSTSNRNTADDRRDGIHQPRYPSHHSQDHYERDRTRDASTEERRQTGSRSRYQSTWYYNSY